MTEPRTNLKRWTLLVGVTGVALEAMGTLALRWRPGRRACGSRLTIGRNVWTAFTRLSWGTSAACGG